MKLSESGRIVARLRRGAGKWSVAALFGGYTVVTVHDHFAWQRVRWQACDDLMAGRVGGIQVPAAQIDGDAANERRVVAQSARLQPELLPLGDREFIDRVVRREFGNLGQHRAVLDGEHFQPAELRERLEVIAQITPVLWDANATAAAAAGGPLTHAAR